MPSRLLPPWLDTEIAVAPTSTARRASSARMTPLTHERPAPLFAQPGDVVPGRHRQQYVPTRSVGLLWSPPTYEQPEQLVNLWERDGYLVGPGVFLDWKKNSKSFDGLSVVSDTERNLKGAGQPERLAGWSVSADFLDILRVRPALGRGFLPGEDQPGQDNHVVILTDTVWKRQFGGGTDIVGARVRLSAETYTVVGVLPPKALLSADIQFLVPYVIDPKDCEARGESEFSVLARLKPGVGIRRAEEELRAIQQRLGSLYPKFKTDWRPFAVPAHEQITGDIKPKLLLLLGAVSCLLMIACANVAHLLLAKSVSRQKEIAIRVALGAGRWRVMRQVLTESILLGLAGGAFGLLLACGGERALSLLGSQVIPLDGQFHLDARILGVSLLLSLGTGVLFGLVPALSISRPDYVRALKQGRHGSEGGSGQRFRKALVVSEVALAMVLLVVSGLFARSFASLLRAQTGFKPKRAIVMDISLPAVKYANERSRGDFLQQVCERLESLHGVEAAARRRPCRWLAEFSVVR